MLPECRNEGDCFSIPEFSLEKKDINPTATLLFAL